jgi:hypothetical protein
MFLSYLNTVGLVDERGVATPFPHLVIGLKVALRQVESLSICLSVCLSVSFVCLFVCLFVGLSLLNRHSFLGKR